MMIPRKLIVLTGLICCSAPQVNAGSAAESSTPAKHHIQVVIHADGSVVDRLALPHSAKPVAAKNESRQGALPASPEAWLTRMMDPSRHGLAAKNPELFAEWLDAVTEPRFMTALASVAMTPETYTSTLGKVVDPATVRNWAEFANPQIGLRWMAAGLDPRFYQAVFNRMTDGGKLRRWGLHPVSAEKAAASDATSGGEAAARSQQWLQLPEREPKTNPWLLNSVNYRY